MQMWRRVWLSLGLMSILTQAQGWPWSSAEPAPIETPLERHEMAQLRFHAGWQPEAPQVLIIEIGNRLPGPLVCRSVSVQRKDDTQAVQPLQPPLYVPAGASRRVTVPGISKPQMKQWGVSCNCFKHKDSRACQAPP